MVVQGRGFHGESPRRIGFLRAILEAAPQNGWRRFRATACIAKPGDIPYFLDYHCPRWPTSPYGRRAFGSGHYRPWEMKITRGRRHTGGSS